MSLVQLLSVGRSLLNIQDRPSPYRMRQDHLLPKFGRVEGREPEKRAVREVSPRENRKEPKVNESQEVKVKRGGSLFRWMKRANPFARKPAAAAPEKAPVQYELVLDSIKPVRNDLHDTDLMVVPARAAENKTAATGRETEPAGMAGKTSSRIFGKK
ncbi:MAG: hypothetical protein JWM16_880 [Verrucomicrobiales bacterium]|nr:hypothetical protein [Verrucomicrobiales bacterium]